MTTAPRIIGPGPADRTNRDADGPASACSPPRAAELPSGAATPPDQLAATAPPAAPDHPAATLPAPQALLLDFGGVVVTTTARATWARELAEVIDTRARALGTELDLAEVEASLRAGRTALSLWKNAASRRLEPRELTAREIVADFLLADLPPTVRAALALEAGEILAAMAPLVADHQVRPGIRELLTECRTRRVRLAIVSNAHSGRAHRTILANLGLADYFGVQIYSDEIGIRKPHPDMIRRATGALGVEPVASWYVGDTLDRDVAAGRRAEVGAVVITRDRRTDHPPFTVTHAPDLVLETPEGLLEHLRTALDGSQMSRPAVTGDQVNEPGREGASPARQRAGEQARDLAGSSSRSRPALLLDHGGVITLSAPNPQRDQEIGARIVAISERIGAPVDLETATRAVAEGWQRHRLRKRRRDALTDPAHRHEEVDPAMLWGDLIGAELPEPLRAALRIEAPELSLALHRTKSVPEPRHGVIELIRWCHERGIVVGIVSNTISGRGVREILARYGLTSMIGPSAYSDEIGVRKPGGLIFEAALAGLETDPADVVYVGDKAVNDGRGGRDAGIGTICLLRGGKDSDETLEAARAAGETDHVLDSPADVIEVLAARLAGPAAAGSPAPSAPTPATAPTTP